MSSHNIEQVKDNSGLEHMSCTNENCQIRVLCNKDIVGDKILYSKVKAVSDECECPASETDLDNALEEVGIKDVLCELFTG